MISKAPAKVEPRVLALIFAAALLVRGVVLFELSQAPFFSSVIGDGLGYHVWAERIASGDWLGQGVFYQAPLYPYLIGILYTVTGATPLWVKLAQIVLDASACVLLTGAGARYFGSVRVGILTGALAALYAPAIFFTMLVQKATLSFFLTSAALDLLSRVDQRLRRPRILLLLGLCLGFLALTRENALIFIVLLTVWLLTKVRAVPRRTIAAGIALFLLGAGIPLLAVGARNAVVGGDFTLTTSQFGTNFFIGNNANSKGFYLPLRFFRGNVKHERDDAVAMAEASTGRKLSPAEVSQFWTEQALNYILEDPVDWLELMIRKSLLVWNRVEAADTQDIAAYRHFSRLLDLLARVFHFGMMVPLAALGLWWTRRRWRELGILYLMMATYAASLTLFFLFARYRIPLVPMILLFAAVGIEALSELVKSRDRRAQGQAAIIAGCTVAMANLPLTDTDTQLAATYKNFGTIMIEKENFSKAVEYFEKSLSYRPDIAETLRGMAESLADLGRFEASEDHFRRLLKRQPDSFLGNLGLGRVLLIQGEYEEGIARLERAARLEPTRMNPRRFLAAHYEERGQLVRARIEYLKVLAREPENSQLRGRIERIEKKLARQRPTRGSSTGE